MNLPHANAVEIATEKITDYLLNPHHPDGVSKAKFFVALGFRAEAWQVMADALRELAARFPVANESASRHGVKYVVDGALRTPVGKTPTVRTVWIIEEGSDTPRFVTAYPREEGEGT